MPPADTREPHVFDLAVAGNGPAAAGAVAESFVSVVGSLSFPGGEVRPIRAEGIKEYPITRLRLQR